MDNPPNIILILNDDMGFSDLGCYGGEVETPTLDGLAKGGLRFTQFYNTARCCPSRASLLTGLHPHQTGVAHMMRCDDVDGYLGDLAPATVTIPEALKAGGYRSYMTGKWHVTRHVDGPKHNWPMQRGFDDFWGFLMGAANFWQPQCLLRGNEARPPHEGGYFTDRISDEAVRQIHEHQARHSDKPFFQYVAYTAPHWPLHAPEEDIAKYKGRFDEGWDVLREKRLERLKQMGIVAPDCPLSPRDEGVEPWESAPHKEWEARRMEVYAAQIDRMDQGIGRIVEALQESGQWDNTLIVFLADNGGCAEGISQHTKFVERGSGTAKTLDGREVRYGNSPNIWPGAEDTYASYGTAWANLSNTPFRKFKHWVHEGGIATPLIAHWPRGILAKGELRHAPGQLPDLMATFLDLAGVEYPAMRNGHPLPPCEGFSLREVFEEDQPARGVLYFEHEGNCAVRKGDWKLVRAFLHDWELYNLAESRSETTNLAGEHPGRVAELQRLYEEWAERCHVWPWEKIKELRRK